MFIYGNKLKDYTILLEQIRTIDKDRLHSYKTHLNNDIMKKVDNAILHSLGLIDN